MTKPPAQSLKPHALSRYVLTLLLPLVILPTLTPSAAAQSVDEIVERHLAAIGGREALGKLTSRKVTGTVTLSRPTGDLSGSVEIYAKAPNKTRSVIRLNLSALGGPGEMTTEQIFDGKTGYALNSIQGESEIKGRQLDAMRNNVFPTPLLMYKAAGAALEVLPREEVNGRDAIVLRVTPKIGAMSRIFFDAETYLIVRTVTTVDSPAGGPLEQTSELSEYRTVDGLKVPFLVVNANQLQTVTIALSKVEHNVEIDDAMFVKK
jgi:outer membrane lipoprotein-sorting protein